MALSLAEENDKLREENRQLLDLLKLLVTPTRPFPRRWRLKPREARILHALIKHEWRSQAQVLAAMTYDLESVDPKAYLYVAISNLRAKLRPLGVTIAMNYGDGYSISKANRAKLNELWKSELE